MAIVSSSIENGQRAITPLFLVLLVVESTDVLFAVDSVPAIFGVTKDPFIVFTSNIFAILGLRALYFLLAGVMDMFRYLHYGLAAVLAFVGLKMVAEYWLERHLVESHVSLLIIVTLWPSRFWRRSLPPAAKRPPNSIDEWDWLQRYL